MKKVLYFALFAIMTFSFSTIVYGVNSTSNESTVTSIELHGEKNSVEWSVEGYSIKGFKVVWSEVENPTYPLRKSDRYLYFNDPKTNSTDDLTPVTNSGYYYVRVCEYLGGKCGVYSNQVTVFLGKENDPLEELAFKDYVASIYLFSNSDNLLTWITDGNSEKGHKVIWSKNSNPTYPTRHGDKYLYFSNPETTTTDDLHPFDGSGTYYVRVCEYLGGKCGVYSNEIKINLTGSFHNTKPAENSLNANNIAAINLVGENGKIKWEAEGYSPKGFKILWSKNENPSYPLRDGDKYHYFSHPDQTHDILKAFDGTGNYYVRVCEYLGGKCGVYSNEIILKLLDKSDLKLRCGENDEYAKDCSGDDEDDDDIKKMKTKASHIVNDRFDDVLAELKELRNLVREQEIKIKYLSKLKDDLVSLSGKVEDMVSNFITYGVDDNTQRLGAGERAAVMHSYKSAFGRLPEDADEFEDAIKIANGRWPTLKNEDAEKRAKKHFKKIYKKVADMNNPNDNAAVTVMAYGLRQKAENRNLESEKIGITTFKHIYGYHPSSTDDWNIMQAITYSGSARGVDTDGDGVSDGDEVANGFDPLVK